MHAIYTQTHVHVPWTYMLHNDDVSGFLVVYSNLCLDGYHSITPSVQNVSKCDVEKFVMSPSSPHPRAKLPSPLSAGLRKCQQVIISTLLFISHVFIHLWGNPFTDSRKTSANMERIFLERKKDLWSSPEEWQVVYLCSIWGSNRGSLAVYTIYRDEIQSSYSRVNTGVLPSTTWYNVTSNISER